MGSGGGGAGGMGGSGGVIVVEKIRFEDPSGFCLFLFSFFHLPF